MMDVLQVGGDRRAMDLGNLFRTFDLGQALEPMAVMPAIVEPAALVAGAREYFIDRLPFGHSFGPMAVMPAPRRPVADRYLGGDGQPAGLDADQQLPPTLRAFADPDMEAEQFLPALGRCPDDDEDTLGLILR